VRAGYGSTTIARLFSYLSRAQDPDLTAHSASLSALIRPTISVATGATPLTVGTTLPAARQPRVQLSSPTCRTSSRLLALPGIWPTNNLLRSFPVWRLRYQQQTALHAELDTRLSISALQQLMFEAGYVGITARIWCCPFLQPTAHRHTDECGERANQFYGGTSPAANQNVYYTGLTPLDTEPIYTNEYAGNAPIRVPYPGYDMNAVLYKAEGTSNFDALQLQVHKRLTNGLQFTSSYTWSHSLDEQSGLGLFFTGNNPANPRANYASSDFDQTHVF